MIEAGTVLDQLADLQRRLDEGWSVEPPLLHRSLLHGNGGRTGVFEVVLCRRGERRVVALCDDPDTLQFAEQRQLPIVEV